MRRLRHQHWRQCWHSPYRHCDGSDISTGESVASFSVRHRYQQGGVCVYSIYIWHPPYMYDVLDCREECAYTDILLAVQGGACVYLTDTPPCKVQTAYMAYLTARAGFTYPPLPVRYTPHPYAVPHREGCVAWLTGRAHTAQTAHHRPPGRSVPARQSRCRWGDTHHTRHPL
jgi:hypothetical protein